MYNNVGPTGSFKILFYINHCWYSVKIMYNVYDITAHGSCWSRCFTMHVYTHTRVQCCTVRPTLKMTRCIWYLTRIFEQLIMFVYTCGDLWFFVSTERVSTGTHARKKKVTWQLLWQKVIRISYEYDDAGWGWLRSSVSCGYLLRFSCKENGRRRPVHRKYIEKKPYRSNAAYYRKLYIQSVLLDERVVSKNSANFWLRTISYTVRFSDDFDFYLSNFSCSVHVYIVEQKIYLRVQSTQYTSSITIFLILTIIWSFNTFNLYA